MRKNYRYPEYFTVRDRVTLYACFTAIISGGSFPAENTKRAAFPLPGIPCASTPAMQNTAKKILIVENDGSSFEMFNIKYNGKTVAVALDGGAVGTFVW